MLQRPIPPLIYHRLYPYPQQNDPTDFNNFVSTCIVPEVRQETMRFYGEVTSVESTYPGLDYANKGHRTRLRLYTYHRRLFRAFDDLKLSAADIYGLCTWEGTKYVKDRYEREHGQRIRDTTWDGMKWDNRAFFEVQSVPASRHAASTSHLRGGQWNSTSSEISMDGPESDQLLVSDDTDEEIVENSVGHDLQQRLINATAARARGEPAVLDPAWEQWMKDQTDLGVIPQNPRGSAATSGLILQQPYTYTPPTPMSFGSLYYQPGTQHTLSPASTYTQSPTIRSVSNSGLVSSIAGQQRMGPPRLLPSPRHRAVRSTTTRPSASRTNR